MPASVSFIIKVYFLIPRAIQDNVLNFGGQFTKWSLDVEAIFFRQSFNCLVEKYGVAFLPWGYCALSQG